MRVAILVGDHTLYPNWVATARAVADVVTIQLTRRVSPRLVAVGPHVFTDPEDANAFTVRRGAHVPVRIFGRAADVPDERRLTGALQSIADERGPVDLIHAHFYSSARFLHGVQRRTGIPYIVTEHSSLFTGLNPEKDAPVGRKLRTARRVYEHAAATTAVSEYLASSIRRLGLRPPDAVIPNPVDAATFSPAAATIPPSAPIVVVGRISPVKRVDAVVNAVALVRDRGPAVAATIVGDGPDAVAVRSLVHDLGLDDAVTFTGWRHPPEIATHLQGAAALVLASLTENCPLSVIEALLCGVPVVAPRVGGLPELVGEGDGVLYGPGPEALADAITSVVRGGGDDRDARAARARARFSFEAIGAQLRPVYERAATVSRPNADR